MSALAATLARLRSRRGRSLLAATGIAAASIMVGTAVVISFGLATGFDRAAVRADLPDVVARFNETSLDDVVSRVESLPNLEASSFALERNDLGIEQFGGEETNRTIVAAVGDGRRGYAVLEGSDLSGAPGEVLVEQGLATDWDLEVGEPLYVDTLGPLEIRGIVLAPEDVAYPLASRARVWVSADWLGEFFVGDGETVNVARIWARDAAQLDPLLVQARGVSFGLENLRFVTVEGIRSLVGQAAGIVIALLIAFSLVAVAAAGVALGATARADVGRQLATIGIMRAVGLSRATVARRYALDAAVVAVPAAAAGLAIGASVASGPSSRLLGILNELPPGGAVILPLAACLLAIVAIVVGATVWPAWRAGGLVPARTLRGAELPATPRRRSRMPGGPFGLGLRLAGARRGRTLTTGLVVGAATSVVLLMLALATFLTSLQDDPGAIGKRFELSAAFPAERAAELEAVPGVALAAPRYELSALDSFRLAETVEVISFPGDHVPFEAPPLAEGRRLAAAGEAEVGQGLADSLGLEVGGTLAVQLPDAGEARFEVVGIVRAIDNEGRVAYVRPDRLLAAGVRTSPPIAIKLDEGADPAAVSTALRAAGADPDEATGATPRDQEFLGVLAGVLRVVAAVNGLICLFILVQALAVTAAERRQSLAVLRAAGAGRRSVTLVLAGAAGAVLVVAIPLGIALERYLLGPLVSRLAAGYATPGLVTPLLQVLVVVVVLVGLALLAADRVARRSERASIPIELRGGGGDPRARAPALVPDRGGVHRADRRHPDRTWLGERE